MLDMSRPKTASTQQISRRATVVDIAREAGVSHTAVSLALRGSPRVGKAQTEQIRKIAESLGYRPRVAAQMLRSGRTGHIELMMESGGPTAVAESGFYTPILAHFIDCCQVKSIRYNIEYLQKRLGQSFQVPAQLAGGMVDGLILAGFVDKDLRRWLNQQSMYPWISLDEAAEYCVMSASDKGIYEAVRHLVAQGHRRIAFSGGPAQFATHRLEFEGFQRAIADFNVPPGDDSWVQRLGCMSLRDQAAQWSQWARTLLRQRVRPTAFVCHGRVAREVILAAAAEGLSVPRDVSVMFFGPASDAEHNSPALSSIEPNLGGMVEKAIELLLQRLSGVRLKPCQVWFDPLLVHRETVAPART